MENSRAGLGCTIYLVLVILGLVSGAAGMAAFLGVGPNELIARANGSAAPVLVAVTPVPAVQVVGGAAPGRRLVWRAPIQLDSDTSEPELLVISRNYDRKSDSILLFSPVEGKVRWESPPLGENGNTWVVAYGADMIVIADESTLIGISRADGGRVWEAPLTDRIFYNGCLDCLQVFGDAVVALTDDGELQAFTIARGTPLWSVHLHEATRQLLRVGDMVGVPDSLTKGDSEAGLFVYNPADGTLMRTIEPACQRESDSYQDRPHYYDRVLADAQSGALYWMLDGADCLLRVGMGAFGGEQRIFNPGFTSFDATNVLLADGTLYLSSGQALYAVDSQGQVTTLVEREDYRLQPLEASQGALLALAQRTRGSARLEIWLIDSQSSQQRWSRVLQASDPLAGPLDTGDFAAHLFGDTVALIEQVDDPEELRFDLLNLNNGTSSVSAQIKVADAGGIIRGLAWGNRSVWMAIDELYGVNIASGATLARWP